MTKKMMRMAVMIMQVMVVIRAIIITARRRSWMRARMMRTMLLAILGTSVLLQPSYSSKDLYSRKGRHVTSYACLHALGRSAVGFMTSRVVGVWLP